MKITEQLILGERLVAFEGSSQEIQDRIDKEYGWIRYWSHSRWQYIPAPNIETDKYSDGVWIYSHDSGKWIKP